jgi:hypothetical protein
MYILLQHQIFIHGLLRAPNRLFSSRLCSLCHKKRLDCYMTLNAAISPSHDENRNDLNALMFNPRLSQPINLGPHLKIGGRVLNIWGVFYALITYVVALAVLPVMVILSFLCDVFGDKKVSYTVLNESTN